MKCKFEHDGDCCNSGSIQYMCKCKPVGCNSIVPVTNADRIRSMTDDELAMFFFDLGDSHANDNFVDLIDWLKEKTEE